MRPMNNLIYLLLTSFLPMITPYTSKPCTGDFLPPGRRLHTDEDDNKLDYAVHEDYDDAYSIKGRQFKKKQFCDTLCELKRRKKLKDVTGPCVIHINDFGNPSPIFVYDGKLLDNFRLDGKFFLQHNESITVACPGKGRLIVLGTMIFTTKKEAQARCINGKMFEVGNWQGEFNQIECNSSPHLTITKAGKKNTVLQADLYLIGFVVQETLHELYQAYYNSKHVVTWYVHHRIVPNAHLRQLGGTRPYFHMEKQVFGDLNMSQIYNVASQRRSVNALLQENPSQNKFINEIDFLTRTQMVPRLDFVMRTSQRSSYTYINTVPQWKHIKHGDWAKLESGLRARAHELNRTLIVWTGKHETWTAPARISRRNEEIYLARDPLKGHQRIVPVPLYIYKLVVLDSNVTAFVSVNMPSYSKMEDMKAKIFCKDLCANNSQYDWLGWNNDHHSVGFCCSYSEFAAVVTYLPEIFVQNIFS